jgi:hypothetical protein
VSQHFNVETTVIPAKAGIYFSSDSTIQHYSDKPFLKKQVYKKYFMADGFTKNGFPLSRE